MKALLLLAILIFPIIGKSAETDTSGEMTFRRFESFEMDFGKIYGFSKEFRKSSYKSYLSFGLAFNFLSFNIAENLQFTQHIGASISGKNQPHLIEDIQFQDDYVGGLSGSGYRTSIYAGTTLRYTLGENVEIGFPLNYVMRWWGYDGKFYLNEGQNIEPEDVVTNHEANAGNRFKIYKNFAHGFKTGFEFALTAGDRYAFFTRWSFQFFPSMYVYDLPNATFDESGGDLTIPNTSISNRTDMRFVFGIRSSVFRVGKSTSERKVKDDPEVILTPDKRNN